MTNHLFEIKDNDGDEFAAWPASSLTRTGLTADGAPAAVVVRVKNDLANDSFAAYLSAAEVDRVRAALAPFGTPAERPWAVGDEAIVTEDDPSGAELKDGDRVRIAKVNERHLYVELVSGRGRTWAEARRGDRGWCVLPSHIRRPDPDPAPAKAIEIGKEYRLLPGASFMVGHGPTMTSSAVADGVTIVRVGTTDGDGNYNVTGLDGRRSGSSYLAAPQYLAELEAEPVAPQPTPPADDIEIGKEYTLLPGASYRDSRGRPRTSSLASDGATRVRVDSGPDPDGDFEVTPLDGDSAGTGGYAVDPIFLTPLEVVAPPAEAVEVGKEYRLLPRATFGGRFGPATSSLAHTSTTRVRVESGPDSDGDYTVTALDGDPAGLGGHYVDPKYLAELEPAAPAAPEAAKVDLTNEVMVAVRSLDPRRIAALSVASEVLGTGTFGARNAEGIERLATFLLGEEAA